AAYDACSPGDTVIVATGTYTGEGNADLNLQGSGTPGAPITIEAETVGAAVLDGQNVPLNVHVVVDIFGSNNVVRGFEVRNGYAGGIFLFGNDNQILQNVIHDNGGVYNGPDGQCGIYEGPATSGNSYVGNYVHDNGRILLASNQDHGLYLCGDND